MGENFDPKERRDRRFAYTLIPISIPMEFAMNRISSVGILVVLLAITASSQDVRSASPSFLNASFGKLPLHFVENRGVYPDKVAFSVQGADKTLFFAKDGITFRLRGKDGGWVVKLEFIGANPDVVLRGEDPQQAVFSYLNDIRAYRRSPVIPYCPESSRSFPNHPG